MPHRLFRRLAALAATALLVTGCAGPAGAPPTKALPDAAPPIQLPAPTGPYEVGTTSRRMVDIGRTDPLAERQAPRELMVQYWYPASPDGGSGPEPYATPRAAASIERMFTLPPGALVGARSHSWLDPPTRPDPGGYPVVVYAHGLAGTRTDNTATAEELASHGFVVVAMDSTHESPAVEFPDGRVVTGDVERVLQRMELAEIVALRVADTRFLLDELAAGRAPAVLVGALDLDHVGMFGHSLGGAAAAAVMHVDERVDAGVNLDGFIQGPVTEHGLARPFLIMGSGYHTPEGDPTWASFLPRLTGWHEWLKVTGAGHYSFTDYGGTARAWNVDEQLPPEQWYRNFGEIDGQRALAIQRAYTLAFFDRFLRGADGTLLTGPDRTGPDPAWPEMKFMPA